MHTCGPSRDSPEETEIQSLIAKQDFDAAYSKAYMAYWEALAKRCVNGLRGSTVNDPQADGQDVASEVFQAFWEALPKDYKPELGSVFSYLRGIADKRIVTRLRAESRQRRLGGVIEAEHQAAASSNPETVALDQERESLDQQTLEQLQQAMSSLPPSIYREVVILVDKYKVRTPHIADAKGLREDNIRQRLSRARRMLREYLHDR